MPLILILACALAAAIGAYFYRRTMRLHKDRDQHHLASMLISIASGRDEVSREDVRAFLAGRNYGAGERAYRLNHAAKLAGTAVRGALYDQVVALAREMKSAA